MKRLLALGITVFSVLLCGGCSYFLMPAQDGASYAQQEISRPAPGEASPAPAPSSETADALKVEQQTFTFQKYGKDYRVAYPRFSGAESTELLNETVKAAAMANADGYGYEPDSDPAIGEEISVTVGTAYEITKRGDYISLLFLTDYYRQGMPHPGKTAQSVNFDVRAGRSLRAEEIADIENDAFAAAVWKAVQKEAPPEILETLSLEVLKESLPRTAVYLAPDGMGFALEVPHAVGDLYRVLVPRDEIKDLLRLEVFS